MINCASIGTTSASALSIELFHAVWQNQSVNRDRRAVSQAETPLGTCFGRLSFCWLLCHCFFSRCSFCRLLCWLLLPSRCGFCRLLIGFLCIFRRLCDIHGLCRCLLSGHLQVSGGFHFNQKFHRTAEPEIILQDLTRTKKTQSPGQETEYIRQQMCADVSCQIAPSSLIVEAVHTLHLPSRILLHCSINPV